MEQGGGSEVVSSRDGGVEEGPLPLRAADGGRLVIGADGADASSRASRQGGDRGIEDGPAVADVAAQADQRQRPRARSTVPIRA